MKIDISVSIGELYDKYSILLLKQELIKDESKLKNIQNELFALTKSMMDVAKEYKKSHTPSEIKKIEELADELLTVNGNLWDIEDDLRLMENNKQFNCEFVDNARLVYQINDRRSEIKKEINILMDSEIIEEKSYEKYD